MVDYALVCKSALSFPSTYNSTQSLIDPSPVVKDSWLYCLNYVQFDPKGYALWYQSKLKETPTPHIPIRFSASDQLEPNIVSGVRLEYPFKAPRVDHETSRLCFNLVVTDAQMLQLIRIAKTKTPENEGNADDTPDPAETPTSSASRSTPWFKFF